MNPEYGIIFAEFTACDDTNLPRKVGTFKNGVLTTDLSCEDVIPLTKFNATLVEPLENVEGKLLGKVKLINKYILP